MARGRPAKSKVLVSTAATAVAEPNETNETISTPSNDQFSNSVELLNNAIPETESFHVITPSIVDISECPNMDLTTSLTQEIVPKRTDPAWHDYVMKEFIEDELINGKPNAIGLRRVFEKLVGIVQTTDVSVIQAPNADNDNHAVVQVKIAYLDLESRAFQYVSDAADVYFGNTAEPYFRHSVATAVTIAESRCYRKSLRLRTISADEDSQPKGQEAELQKIIESTAQLATPAQKKTIEKLSQTLGIKYMDKLFKLIFNNDNILLENLSQEDAAKVLRQLNSYQNGPKKGGTPIPEELFEPVAQKEGQ